MKTPIYVTRPFMPPQEEYEQYLKQIWQNKWLTNEGPLHAQLEHELSAHLGVKHISLFSNGTLALITALQALRITGEVITTPFSFVATTHSLWWNGIKPVFVDIEPETYNLDPERIEAAITPRTTAIMPVHVYGSPCQVDKIQAIADKYNLKVIYDAAHAFGVEVEGQSILNAGDLSILSFHATKVYSSIEGGAIISHDPATKKRIDFMKNFGFADEVTVVAPGINGKMNEFQAGYGLLQLKYIDGLIERRRSLTERYRQNLEGVSGLRMLPARSRVKENYGYLPVLIDKEAFGRTRDDVYNELKEHNIFARRYFYPLISEFPTYKGLASAYPENLPVAGKIAEGILCLPLYPDLEEAEVDRICALVKPLQRRMGPKTVVLDYSERTALVRQAG